MPETLTPLQQDQLDSGWHFFIVSPDAYEGLAGYVDATRGYPIGGEKASTLRGLPPIEDLTVTNDDSGYVMLMMSNWRVEPEDIETLAPYIDQGLVEILTEEEWLALLPMDEEEIPQDLPEDLFSEIEEPE